MKALLDAIRTFAAHADSGPLTDTFTGGFWLREAASGKAFPYVVMDIIAAPTTSKYGGAAFSEPTIQFTAYGSAATTLANIETLMAAFDEKTFTLAGSKSNFYMVREHDPVPTGDVAQDENGNEAYGWAVTYRYATT